MAKTRFTQVNLPHIPDDQLRRFVAACARRARLSPEQLAQYDSHNYFEVTGCHTGKRYRIHHGFGTNVYELDDGGVPRVGWCFVPDDHLVAGDVMLAQKIALETDERGALAVANNFTRR